MNTSLSLIKLKLHCSNVSISSILLKLEVLVTGAESSHLGSKVLVVSDDYELKVGIGLINELTERILKTLRKINN